MGNVDNVSNSSSARPKTIRHPIESFSLPASNIGLNRSLGLQFVMWNMIAAQSIQAVPPQQILAYLPEPFISGGGLGTRCTSRKVLTNSSQFLHTPTNCLAILSATRSLKPSSLLGAINPVISPDYYIRTLEAATKVNYSGVIAVERYSSNVVTPCTAEHMTVVGMNLMSLCERSLRSD